MKINILLLFLFLFTSDFVKAQSNNKVAVSLGIDVAFPSANSIGGPGFSGKVELPLTFGLYFTAGAGYFVNYFGTRYYADFLPAICSKCTVPSVPTGPVNKGPYEFIPVKTGLRYYFFRHFYIAGEIGEALKANVTNNSFIYGGAVGGLIPFNKHNSLDLNIGYENGYQFADYNPTIYETFIRVAYRYRF